MHRFALKSTALAIASILAISGCRVDEPDELKTSVIEGIASDALVVNGTVQAIHIPSGRVVATTKTDDKGFYTFEALKAPAGYYKLRLQGGEYVEEATGDVVYLEADHFLEAIQYHKPGVDLGVAITPLTTVATSMALCYSEKGDSLQNATNKASSEVAQAYGIDIFATYPLNITDPVNQQSQLTNGHKYGYIQAGRSEQVRQVNALNGFEGHSQYASIDLVGLAYADARYDCVLDGKGQSSKDSPKTQLSMGMYDLSSETYRTELARNIIRAAGSDYNKLSFKPIDLLDTALKLTNAHDAMFNYEPVQMLDSEGPSVSWDLNPEQVRNQTFTVAVTASDFVGTKSASLYVDGQFIEASDNSDNIFFNIDTTRFTDGDHTVTVMVYDNLDNYTELSATVTFDNTGPVVEYLGPEFANSDTYEVQLRVTDANGIDSVIIDGAAAKLEYGLYTRTINLPSDTYSFDIIAEDTLGEVTTISHTVQRDSVLPVINVYSSDAPFVATSTNIEQYLSLDHNLSDYALVVNKTNYKLGSSALTRSALSAAEISHLFFEAKDGESEWATPADELKVEYRVKIAGGVVVPWSDIPQSGTGYVLPFTLEYLSSYILVATMNDIVTIDVRVVDKAGNIATHEWSSPMAIQLNRVIYNLDDLDENELFGYRFVGARGGMLNMCTVASGTCTIAFPNDEEEIQASINRARYSEPYNGDVIDSNGNILGYTLYSGVEVDDFISPFSSVFAGFFDAAYRAHDDFALAYAEAEAEMLKMYGFNPMTASPVNPASEDHLSEEAKHGLLLKALSKAAFEVESQFSPEYNSITFAWASYRDLRDGVIDGYEFGSATRIGNSRYNANKVKEEIAIHAVNIAEEAGVSYLDEVVEYSLTMFTPMEPTVDINFIAGEYNGNIDVNPRTEADSALNYVLTFNGVRYAGNSSSYTVDTKDLEDGQYTMTIEVTDRWGQVATDEVEVFIDNTPPVIEGISNHLVTNQSQLLAYSVNDGSGVGVNTVFIQSVETEAIEGVYQQPLNLKSGQNTIIVRASDNLGNTSEHQMLVIVVDDLPGDYDGTIDFLNTVPNGNSLMISVGNTVINPVDGKYLIDTTRFEDGTYTVDLTLSTVNGDVYDLSIPGYVFDNNEPTVELTSFTWNNSELYTVEVEVVDQGSEVVDVKIDNIDAIRTDNLYSVQRPTNRGFTKFTVTAEDRLGYVASESFNVARVLKDAGNYKDELVFLKKIPVNTMVTLAVGEVELVFTEGQDVAIDTSDFGDGIKRVSLEYTNELGNSDVQDLGQYVFDHVPPTINLTSPLLVDSEDYVLEFNVDDLYTNIASVSVNGIDLEIDGDLKNHSLSKSVSLGSDVNSFTIRTQDALGNESEATYMILLFDEFNELFNNGNAGVEGYLSGAVELFSTTPVEDFEYDIRAKINGSLINQHTPGNAYSHNSNLLSDGETEYELTVSDSEGRTSKLVKRVYVDNTPPTVAAVSNHLTTNQNPVLSYDIKDNGVDLESVSIGGVTVSSATSEFSISQNLSKGNNIVPVVAKDYLGNTSVYDMLVVVFDDLPGDYTGSINFLNAVPNGNSLSVTVNQSTDIALNNGKYVIDTNAFADGYHDVKVDLETVNGDQFTYNLDGYVFDNNAPEVGMASSTISSSPVYPMVITATDAGSEVVSVRIDDADLSKLSGSNYGRDFATTPGFNTFTIEAIDRLGHKYENKLSVARVSSLSGNYPGNIDVFGSNVPQNSIVELSVDGVNKTFTAGQRPVIVASDYSDGELPVSVKFTNEMGRTDTIDAGLYVIDRTPPMVHMTSPVLTENSSYQFAIDIEDTYSPITAVTINGFTKSVSGSSVTESINHNVTLQDDFNKFTVVVTDSVGNNKTYVFGVVRFDALTDGSFEAGTISVLDETPSTSDEFSMSLAVNGSNQARPVSGSAWSVDTRSVSDGSTNIQLSVSDSHGNTGSITKSILVDNTPPSIESITNHLLTVQSTPMSYDVVDSGSGIQSVRIANGPVVSGSSTYSRHLNLSAGQNVIKVEATDKVGNNTTHNMLAIVLDKLPGDYEGNINYLSTVPNGNSLVVSVDGNTILPVSSRYTIDTSSYSDGIHNLYVRLTTENGDVHVLDNELNGYTFDNHPPVVTQVSNAITQDPIYNFVAEITDAGSEVVSVSIDNSTAVTKSGNRYSRNVTTNPGFKTVPVRAEDRLGHTYSDSISIARVSKLAGNYKGVLDLFGQSVPSKAFVELSVGDTDLVYIAGERVSVNTTEFGDGIYPLSIRYTTQNADTFTANLGNYVFDHAAPTVELKSPIITDSSNYTLQLDVTDSLSDIKSVTVNGSPKDVSRNSLSESIVHSTTLTNDFTRFEVVVTDSVDNTETYHFGVVRFDSLTNVTYKSGSFNILDATPKSTDLFNVTLSVNGTGVSNPASGAAWPINTTAFADGNTEFRFSVSDRYGNNQAISGSKFTKSIIIDNTNPSLHVTSSSFVGSKDYTLVFNTQDATSGLQKVTVDGVDVAGFSDGQKTNATLSKGITLSQAEQTFTVVSRDKALRETTRTHTVKLDTKAPEIKVTKSKARVWNMSTGSAQYQSTFGTSDTLLFIAEHLAGNAGGHPVDEQNPNADMWLHIAVEDVIDATSAGTTKSELTVAYRHLYNGVQVKSWAEGLLAAGNPGEYFLPLTSDYLDTPSMKAMGTHRLEMRVTDFFGYSTTAFVEFNSIFKVESAVTITDTADVNGISGLTIPTAKSTLNNATREFGGVTYTNDTDGAVYVKVSDIGNNPTATVTREQWQRYNRGRWEERKSWRVYGAGTCSWTPLADGTYVEMTESITAKYVSEGQNSKFEDGLLYIQEETNGDNPEAIGSSRLSNLNRRSVVVSNSWGTVETNQFVNTDSPTQVSLGFTKVNDNNWSFHGPTYTGYFVVVDDPKFYFHDDKSGSDRDLIWYELRDLYPASGFPNSVAVINQACMDLSGDWGIPIGNNLRYDQYPSDPQDFVGTNLRAQYGYDTERRFISDTANKYPKNERNGTGSASVPASKAGMSFYVNGSPATIVNGYIRLEKDQSLVIRKKVTLDASGIHTSVSPTYGTNRPLDIDMTVSVDEDIQVRVVSAEGVTNTSLLDNMPASIEEFTRSEATFGF